MFDLEIAFRSDMLRENGIDVNHLVNLLQRLETKAGAGAGSSALGYLSSHPATAERLDRLRAQE